MSTYPPIIFPGYSPGFTFLSFCWLVAAGEDYVDTSSVYRPALGSKCVRIQTIDNGRIEDPRYFTFSFGSGPENHLTVILPSSIRVVLMDNDGEPICTPFVPPGVFSGQLRLFKAVK